MTENINISSNKELEDYVVAKVNYFLANIDSPYKNYADLDSERYFTEHFNYPGVYYFYKDNKFYMNNYERGGVAPVEQDLEEMLSNIFGGITFSLAEEYEVKHRVSGKDFRRILFAKQREYLKFFGDEYVDKHDREVEEILRNNPFVDR